MITVSEGMSLDDLAYLEGRRRRIRGLKPGRHAKWTKKKAFVLRERPSKTRYARIGPATSVTVPPQEVKVVGYNQVVPTRDPDIVPVNQKVFEIQPGYAIKEEATLPEGAAFRAETEMVDVPGLPATTPPLPQIPEWTVPPGRAKLAKEEMEVQAEAGPELEGLIGGHRISEAADFDDVDEWEKAIHETVAQDTRAIDIVRRSNIREAAEARRAKDAEVRSAAEFEQKWSEEFAQRVSPKWVMVDGVGRIPEELSIEDLDQFDITSIIKGATEAVTAYKERKAEKKAREREKKLIAAEAARAKQPAFVAPVVTDTGLSTTTIILIVVGGVAVLGTVLFLALRK